MNLVVDASMALSWLLARAEADEAALAVEVLALVAQQGAEVPSLWYLEIANTVLVLERARRVASRDAEVFLSDLNRLTIRQDTAPVGALQAEILALARTHGLTAYDASYLELARRTGSTLATFDRRLASACRQAGVPVLGDAGLRGRA